MLSLAWINKNFLWGKYVINIAEFLNFLEVEKFDSILLGQTFAVQCGPGSRPSPSV